MHRRPRPPQAGILTRESLVPLLGIGVLVAGPTLAAYAWGDAEGGVELGRRMAFATLIGTQLAASLEFRSPTRSFLGLRRNPWLLAAIAASVTLLFAVFYLPFLQPAFRTEGLSAAQWLGVLGLASIPLIVVEAAKLAGLGRWLESASEPEAAAD